MDSAIHKLRERERIYDAWNNGKCIAGVFCDLTKAFSCVNHELLVKKWNFMVLEVFFYWFTTYLDGRKETVHLKLLQSNKISNLCNVRYWCSPGICSWSPAL